MNDAFLAYVMLYGPALPPIAAAFYWSHETSLPLLARLLKWSAFFWAVLIPIVIIAFIIVAVTCDGNALYGYGNCQLVPTNIANLSLATILLTLVSAVGYTLLLFTGGLIAELISWRKRRNTDA